MITNQAVLAELGLRVWDARKQDKSVSREVDAMKGAVNGGNYHKYLLGGNEELTAIKKFVGSVRTWHYKNTLPWSDEGARLLPMARFQEYKTQLSKFEEEFTSLVERFHGNYDVYVMQAQNSLGAMFDIEEYPTADSVRGKFSLKYTFSPVPQASDFRITAEEETVKALELQYSEAMDARVQTALNDAWDRLYDVLNRLSERLDGEDKIFRNTLVGNALELCDMLKSLNITGDEKMESARKALESAMVGVTADELRGDTALKTEVKGRVDEILKVFW